VPVVDGMHHPSNTGGGSRQIGTLRFATLDQGEAC
jgi:hypothetical protein